MTPFYDAVIVGAGLSGLSAAHGLKGWDILVIEKEPRAGGRVDTRRSHGITYELGAIFPYPTEVVPFPLAVSPLIPEAGPVGISIGGRVSYGESVAACLKGIGPAGVADAAAFLRKGDFASLGVLFNEAISAFFKVIHPGELRSYLPQRRTDALARFDTSRHRNGNGELVDAYLDRLSARPFMNAEVQKIRRIGDLYEIVFSRNGETEKVSSRSVIVTTPAPVAARIVADLPAATLSFLQGVEYGRGTVVVVALKGDPLDEFAYIVTPGLPCNTVIRHGGMGDGIVLLTVYYVGEASRKLQSLGSCKVIAETVALLGQIGIGTIGMDQVIMSDLKNWEMIGPLITPAAYGGWHDRHLRPVEGLFLAGDFLSVNRQEMMPYGMSAAIVSGKRAAAEACDYLGKRVGESGVKVSEEPFRPEMLTTCHLYRITATEPFFAGWMDEGDVAYYGLILQSEYDDRIVEYLLASAKGGLWEYQHGYGVTSADSALVIEGLFASGASRELLLESLRALVRGYFCREEGAFKTVLDGRAAYWRGVSVETTAHLAYLLHMIAPEEYRSEIAASAAYLRTMQHEDGHWSGKWFPSQMIPTYHSLRFLSAYDGAGCVDSIRKGRNWIVRQALPCGSWNNSVIDTSAALLALSALNDTALAVERGKSWLLSRRAGDSWQGEPVLYYWFEEGRDKLFFSCHDKGRITTAWARLALKAESPGVAV